MMRSVFSDQPSKIKISSLGIIGNFFNIRGQLKYFNYKTGEYLNNLKGHSNEVSGLKVRFLILD